MPADRRSLEVSAALALLALLLAALFWYPLRRLPAHAYAGVVVAAAAVVRRLAGRAQAGLLCLLCCGLWIPMQSPDRIGMNHPQLLGENYGVSSALTWQRSMVRHRR